ncbi:MAG: hypothetical protein PVJ61_01710 [Dehalococcoidia bacterium]|jgi:hypothetical protein
MITIESMTSVSKDDLPEAAEKFTKNDITQLVEWLSFKDDDIRYQAFLLLQSRSQFYDDVYPSGIHSTISSKAKTLIREVLG